jgi:energy-coupling factor transporter transmembrane protein EcfT
LAKTNASLARAYSPPGALICSGLYLTLAALVRGPWPLLVASILAISGQVAYLRRIEPAAFLAKVTLPLVFPLLGIHGILNPHFPADCLLWGCIPLRSAGAAFAVVIASRLLLVAAAMAVWRYTVGYQVIGYFHRVGLPSAVITGFAVATSSIEVVQQKGRAVYLAQQARGINLRASFSARVASLPKLVIPVAVATIVESGERGIMMESRGLGSGPWRLQGWYSPPPRGKILMELASAAVTLAAFAVR